MVNHCHYFNSVSLCKYVKQLTSVFWKKLPQYRSSKACVCEMPAITSKYNSYKYQFTQTSSLFTNYSNLAGLVVHNSFSSHLKSTAGSTKWKKGLGTDMQSVTLSLDVAKLHLKASMQSHVSMCKILRWAPYNPVGSSHHSSNLLSNTCRRC